MNKILIVLNLMVAFLSATLVSCNEDEDDPYGQPVEENIKIATSSEFGKVITDQEGNTLYFFAKDVEGASQCDGACEDAWPVFFAEDVKVGNGLNKDDFSVITRDDGQKQTTFQGWPLYFFSGDNAAGQINGDGVGETWYVAKPDYAVMIGSAEVEGDEALFMVDAKGNSLYFFLQDGDDVSNCEDGCRSNWPIFFQEDLILPSFLNENDFKVITRGDGDSQLSFKKKPVYFFSNDTNRGDRNGHQVGSVWFLLTENVLREEL